MVQSDLFTKIWSGLAGAPSGNVYINQLQILVKHGFSFGDVSTNHSERLIRDLEIYDIL